MDNSGLIKHVFNKYGLQGIIGFMKQINKRLRNISHRKKISMNLKKRKMRVFKKKKISERNWESNPFIIKQKHIERIDYY